MNFLFNLIMVKHALQFRRPCSHLIITSDALLKAHSMQGRKGKLYNPHTRHYHLQRHLYETTASADFPYYRVSTFSIITDHEAVSVLISMVNSG